VLSFIFGAFVGVLSAWVFIPAPESLSDLIHRLKTKLGL
jgi:hypothetical protein